MVAILCEAKISSSMVKHRGSLKKHLISNSCSSASTCPGKPPPLRAPQLASLSQVFGGHCHVCDQFLFPGRSFSPMMGFTLRALAVSTSARKSETDRIPTHMLHTLSAFLIHSLESYLFGFQRGRLCLGSCIGSCFRSRAGLHLCR